MAVDKKPPGICYLRKVLNFHYSIEVISTDFIKD